MSRRILLVNPNSTVATTRMMVAIAQGAAAEGVAVEGATASRSPPLLTEPAALAASAAEVVEIAVAAQDRYAGLIVGAFGDPGLAEIRERTTTSAVGICEAAVHEAADGDRAFGIATTTPALAGAIDERVRQTGRGRYYTGIRVTPGDPVALMADEEALADALAAAVSACITQDGAEAVIIGGGPLARLAAGFRPTFTVPIIEPIPAAVRRLGALT